MAAEVFNSLLYVPGNIVYYRALESLWEKYQMLHDVAIGERRTTTQVIPHPSNPRLLLDTEDRDSVLGVEMTN